MLAHWSGLGYYSRARNLHRAARLVMQQHDGRFPHDFDTIVALPGIGRSTAAAICALAFGQHRAILDGNVKRVLARYCGIEGYTGDKKVEMQLWQQAEALLPDAPGAKDESDNVIATYTQGLMDLGAGICTRTKPGCDDCPVQNDCAAVASSRVEHLPTPRPRKTLPQRYSTFLLLRHDNDILLEKRPDSGIWGGLWCPPQVESADDIAAYCMLHFGLDARHVEALSGFPHTFTHFRLHIAPLLVQVASKPSQVQESGRMWLDVEQALHAAIPKPVRRLLEEMIIK